MADSATQQNLISLGEQLAASLGKPHENDMLSRWMAYYLAEQLTVLKEGAGNTEAKQRACDTILALWAHRHRLPDGFRPFKGFEPILRALEQLDPQNPRSRFAMGREEEADVCDPKAGKVKGWLEVAHATDRASRVLIDLALREATREAKTPETVGTVAAAPESDDSDDLRAIRVLLRRQRELDPATIAQAKVESLEMRIAHLEWFRDTSGKMAAKLAAQLTEAKRQLARTATLPDTSS